MEEYIKAQDRKHLLGAARDLLKAADSVRMAAIALYLRAFAADLLIQAMEGN